ncbi:MAG: cation diffusion facilitator family transporter [Candidatus Thermoplasmatota archaeon]|nr:cation diffusion facilitator family transporter [Candidatus Thermoplasmatota archaeon]
MTLSGILARRIVIRCNGDEKKISYLSSIINIAANCLLFLIKIITGLIIGSIALIGDSIDTLFDVIIAAVVLIGFFVAFKPPDKEHPFGHGRFESIATIMLSMLLMISGAALIYNSSSRLFMHFVISLELWVIAVVIFNILLKFFLVRFFHSINYELNNESIEASALNYLGDVLNSLVVLISFIIYYFTGFEHIDAIAGIFIGLMIFSVGVRFVKSASSQLMGEAYTDESLKDLVLSVDGVSGVHDINKHSYGRRGVLAMHLEVDSALSAEEAHAISERVEKKIGENYRDIDSTVIHIEPVHTAEDEEMEKRITEIIRTHREIKSFHKISVKGRITFHIQVDKNMTVEGAHRLVHELKGEISSFFTGEVEVHVEPYYKYGRDNYK